MHMSDEKSFLKTAETSLESVLFASRWLLAPFYLGLAASLIVLLIKFVAELGHIAAHAFSATESEVILGVLALVDLALTGSLIVIVIFSGYENFVSRIDHGNHTDWPEWMGKIDFSGLKLKLLSSIVAISGIQLLKQFMAIDKVSDRDIMWLVIVHVVFVVSAVLLALSDRLTAHSGGHDKKLGLGGGGSGSGPKTASQHTPQPALGQPSATGTAVTAEAPNAPRTSATAAAAGAHGPAAPPAPGTVRSTSVHVERVEVQRRSAKPNTSRQQQTDAKAKTDKDAATTRQRAAEPDEQLLPGERPPTVKRRLH
jgi:uncharacterized protein (TIGR00645 family)